jgi:membrane-bound metal-dependent hydrolase YbcI (DUF457 family)
MLFYALDQQLEVFSWLFWVGLVLGSYLPDCDHRFALAGHILPLWHWLKHRRHTHSLYFSIVCSAILGVINIWLGVGVFIGMIMHCAGDMTTYYGMKEGLPMFYWPYKKKQLD